MKDKIKTILKVLGLILIMVIQGFFNHFILNNEPISTTLSAFLWVIVYVVYIKTIGL